LRIKEQETHLTLQEHDDDDDDDVFGLNLKQEESRWLGHVCGNNKVMPAVN